MARTGNRGRRLNESLREVIAEAIQRDLSDPRLALVTITGVRATEDMAEARVFWTVYDRSGKDRAAAALASATGVLQGRVARELRTRHTPHLHFVFDEHQDRAERLTQLIDEVAADLPPEPPAAPPGGEA
jgi:ribosome-binding factor A